MLKKFQTFLINVVVIEGRHYVWQNTDTFVMVQVGNQKKCTAVKYSTDCPYYNEHFVFEFSTTLEHLIDVNITLTVIKPGSVLRKSKILGYIIFDVGTVWYQQDHQFYHKWGILSAPKEDYVGGTRGYLKVDVCVLSKGEAPKIPRTINTNEIEGNLLLPYGQSSDRHRINFIVDVYRGIDFVKKHSVQESASKKIEAPNAIFLEISFSGVKIRTSIKKNTSTPLWEERLILPDLFPPLCQRFKIELYHGEGSKRAARYLSLRDISNDKEEGFLPTFGPAFLHFYSSNQLEGYLGKVLISLKTKWIGSALDHEPNLAIQRSPIINEEMLMKYESVTLCAVIFDVSCISAKFSDKPISFRIACGPYAKDLDENGDNCGSSTTPPITPIQTNKNYYYLQIEGSKVCLDLTLTLPDTRKRMYNYNLLTKMLHQFKLKLNKIENIFNEKDYKLASDETENLLLETLDFVSSSAEKYIDIVSGYNFEEDPLLDQQRKKMCLKEMEQIIIMSKSVPVHASKKKIFQKFEKIYSKLELLIDNVEGWPLVYLWMIYGNKRVAYYTIKPENIIHSMVDEEKGINCGSLQTIYFQTDDFQNVQEFISMACQMNVFLWMGLARHWDICLESLPSGFTLSTKNIPKILHAEEKHEFQCRAHIFQGRFSPGSDKSGLCDPYIQVIIGGQYRQTEILKKTLNPVWDQTLFFKNIILYGSIDFILNNPPLITVEILDKDDFWKSETVGKCLIRPIIKTAEESYCPPKFPPKLSSYTAYNKMNEKAEILAAVELLELTQDDVIDDDSVIRKIPQDIKPNLINHRIDVVFWGIREQKPSQMKNFNKPKILIECINVSLPSDTIPNAKKNPNFPNPLKIFDVIFPEQREYAPALSIKMFDCRNFGTTILTGTHVLPMETFFYKPLLATEREKRIFDENYECSNVLSTSVSTFLETFKETNKKKEKHKEKKKEKKTRFFLFKKKNEKLSEFFEEEQIVENEEFNWWTKFYASLETPQKETSSLSNKYKLKIYGNELESQPEFGGFTDLLQIFPLYKGKRTGDDTIDEENTTAVFKGSLKIYPWPPPADYVTASGLPLEQGAFQDFPSNNPVRFVLRVYCIRGLNLRPKDVNGKSDPYLHLTLGNQVVDDKSNKVMGQVNPVFGRFFELNGVFPLDHSLTISVYDWDAMSADDLIGQTKIDLENRFYTRHRAHCGLAEDYITAGYCQWRDQQKPATILENLCKRYNIPEPEYTATSVRLACKDFAPMNFVASDNIDFDRQVLALSALRRWREIPVVGCVLVPEHVETRSLYNSNKPGVEQGKLQLWIDILPYTDLPIPQAVNIVPQKPVAYELRVIIWNAENIKLDDDEFFTGEKKSDIFVKGWLTDPENSQYTDVHYRSLSGEANFNWRFIFLFEYLSNENKIVLKEKSMFGLEATEVKIPCRLNVQVWDNDTFSKHDFLGSLSLDMSKLQRGARIAKNCNLSILEPNVPVMNLFKVRRTRGWWPLKNVDLKSQQEIFAGCVELEFELLTQDDAAKFPAGLGRQEPQALPKPKRPDTSFSWLWNPFKAIKYVVKSNRWKFIKMFLFVLLIIFIVIGFSDLPGYSLQKLLGV